MLSPDSLLVVATGSSAALSPDEVSVTVESTGNEEVSSLVGVVETSSLETLVVALSSEGVSSVVVEFPGVVSSEVVLVVGASCSVVPSTATGVASSVAGRASSVEGLVCSVATPSVEVLVLLSSIVVSSSLLAD